MKHKKVPEVSYQHARCKCGHAIQPGEPRINFKGAYSKCSTCYIKGESIPINDHPLKDEILDKIKSGEIVFS